MKKVVKFGGSSLANAKQFMKAAAIVKAEKSRRYVIPSAPGKRMENDEKVTDLLYRCYDIMVEGGVYNTVFCKIKSRFEEIVDGLGLNLNLDFEFDRIEENFAKRAGRDYAASRGEYLNGLIMAEYLGYEFIDAATTMFFDEHGVFDANKTNRELSERLEHIERAVIPGFYGAMPDGRVKTFSRGGSDITGSIVARAVKADLYENWTDVSGVLMADPHIVTNPQVIDFITYSELRELSYMGVNVLHEDSIFPLRREGIPIHIRNTNQPKDKGTLIVESTRRKPKYTITGIAGKKGFCSMTVEKDMMNADVGFCRKVLSIFEKYGIAVERMPSGIDTLTIFVRQSDFEKYEQSVIAGVYREVKPDSLEIEPDLALIAVAGRGMKTARGTAGRIFSALSQARINVKMIDQDLSERNIIIGVKDIDFEAAIRAIYDIFVSAEL